MSIETQDHLAILRGMLLFQLNEAKAELREVRDTGANALGEAGAHEVLDGKDAAFARQQAETTDATSARLVAEVARCENALERLTEEDYGDCVDCGEPIAWPRLLAQPAAERCTACQQAWEDRTRH